MILDTVCLHVYANFLILFYQNEDDMHEVAYGH